MAVRRITDTAIRAAMVEREESGEEELPLWDDDLKGFGARVLPAVTTFIVKYRIGGGRNARQRKLKLGTFGPLNATQARAAAQSVLRRVARGEDPAGERELRRNDPLVRDVLDDFLLHHADAKRKARTAAEYRRLVDRIIKPAIGRLRVKELETADAARLHQRLAPTPHHVNRLGNGTPYRRAKGTPVE